MEPFDTHDVDADWWAEAHDLVDALGHTLISAQGVGTAPLTSTHVDAMFRDAHTLKGLLRTLDAAALAELASSIEDALDNLRMGRWQSGAQAAQVLLRGIETLAAGCARAQAGVPLDEQALTSVRLFLSAAHHALPPAAAHEPSPLPLVDDEALRGLSELERHRIDDAARSHRHIVRVAVCLPVEQLEQGFLLIERGLLPSGEVLARTIDHVPQDDSQLAVHFWLALAPGGHDVDTTSLAEALQTSVLVSDVHASEVAQLVESPSAAPAGEVLGAEPSPPVEEPAGAASDGRLQAAAPPALDPAVSMAAPPLGNAPSSIVRAPQPSDAFMAQTVRVDIRRLDRLLHSVSELMLAKQTLDELSERVRALPGGASVAVELMRHKEVIERRAGALQAGLMQVRMVPIGQLFERLVRAGQQAAHELGKEVRFFLHGEATELDKHIAEKLVDPMMHLVRNAVDHGIERPDVRRAHGKTSYGIVRLSARTRGSQVVVQVADDGAGIDLDKARSTAVDNHLIAPQAAPLLDEQQIYALLTQPGFSTRREVSAYSGRGVGLDVAKTELEALGGALEVAANEPCGSMFSLVTPVTLAIVPALVVQSAQERYALPLGHVIETLAYEPNDMFVAGARRMLRVGEYVMPLTELSEAFALPRQQAAPALQFVIVVGLAAKRLAVLVDDLLAQQDVVIKSLGPRMSQVHTFAGAADVGVPQMVLVLNTLALLNESDAPSLPGADPLGGPLHASA